MWIGFWQKGHNSRSMDFPQNGHESKSKRFEPLLRRILRYSDLFIVYSCTVLSRQSNLIFPGPGHRWMETQEKKDGVLRKPSNPQQRLYKKVLKEIP
jgi:hypothetical protein